MISPKTIILLITLLCMGFALNATQDSKEGFAQDMSIDVPLGDGPFPCVIICPGRGYHKDLPLIKDLASQAMKAGFVAMRFNWSFFIDGTNPSSDGQKEMGDVERVLQYAKQVPQIDQNRIYLAGKSLGSLYAYAAFQEHPEVKGCLLLTPIIPDSTAGADYYPGLQDEYRKLVFILGSEDIYNCRLNSLYHYLAGSKVPIPVVVLAGGHSFNQAGESKDKTLLEIDEYNLQQAVNASLYWLKTFENPVYTE